MTRIPIRAVSLFALTPLLAACAALPAQRDAAPAAAAAAGSAPVLPARAKGAIFRSEVDRLIGAIATITQVEGKAAPYRTGIAEAARFLTAMGHCHRFYVAADHPRIRATLAALIAGRRDDGSFGESAAVSATTTAWVVDALAALDAERYRDEIATARAWLQQRGVPPAFETMVETLLGSVRGDVFPEHLGAAAAAVAGQLDSGSVDITKMTDTLLQLVACQTANRRLDQGQQPQQPAAVFSPAQQRAFDFLLAQQQDGIFSVTAQGKTFPDPAFTGFGLLALQTKPKSLRTAAENAVIEKGLHWLLAGQNADGSFGRQLQNYTTSVVVGALHRSEDAAAKPALEKARQYILKCQNVEQSGYQSSDRDYGSIGYGGSQRGDLSNVNFALQALRESGLPAEDEAFKKALVFLQRSQNLQSVNDFTGKVSDPDNGGKLIDVTSGDDGGGIYYPGNSAAGYAVTPDGKSIPRSYGSMTYALLKSYTLCGLAADDARVQKAVAWIAANWTLAENPGFTAPPGDKARFAGLFYYYMVLAQALDLAGVRAIDLPAVDGKPKQLDWRKELRAHLEGIQQPNGAWRNQQNARWMEGVDVLCTCYAMLALDRCH